MLRLYILLILFSIPVTLSAKWVDAYVVDNNGELTNGLIKLPKTDYHTGGWFIKGFDFTYFHHMIKFKDDKGNKSIYKPDDIKAYSFVYDDEEYFYISQAVNFISLVPKERQKQYFLKMIYRGSVSLCTYEKELDEERVNAKLLMYHDYYIYNDKYGLKQIKVDSENARIKDILIEYGVSAIFLSQFEKDITIHEVQKVLYQYDHWQN